jgi:hypothetical protein
MELYIYLHIFTNFFQGPNQRQFFSLAELSAKYALAVIRIISNKRKVYLSARAYFAKSSAKLKNFL